MARRKMQTVIERVSLLALPLVLACGAGPTQVEVRDGAPTLAQCLAQTPVRSAYCKQLIARQLGGKP